MDRVHQYLIDQASRHPWIEAVIVFGSRARKDASKRSDYDLAIKTDGVSPDQWAKWALEVRENVPTLCGLDLVHYRDEMNAELRAKINQKKFIIYKQKSKP
jgi:predicted nucleotidyltransferase